MEKRHFMEEQIAVALRPVVSGTPMEEANQAVGHRKGGLIAAQSSAQLLRTTRQLSPSSHKMSILKG